MAGIYSQGGSAGHRYAGWLSEVEAKNFIFGGKVFNGSPSAIYVGSNLVWWYWLKPATRQAIIGAFLDDGMAVINATNAYLNQLAASGQAGKDKATALAGFINEDPMMVCSLGLEVEGVTMPIRLCISDAVAYIDTEINPTQYTDLEFECKANIKGANTYAHALFGVIGNVNAGTGMYGVIYHGTGGIAYRCGTYNSNYISLGKSSPTGLITIKGTKTSSTMELFVDGVSKGTKSVGTPASKSIYLYRTNYSNASVEKIPTPSEIAGFAFRSGANKLANFVPCKHNGENGLYDIDRMRWFGNANSQGSFTIPDISYTPSTP